MNSLLFCTYVDIAQLQQRGIEVVFCMHGARTVDFRRGQKLGRHDHLVEWTKPRYAPAGISPQQFARLPDKLQLRELRYTIQPLGGAPKRSPWPPPSAIPAPIPNRPWPPSLPAVGKPNLI